MATTGKHAVFASLCLAAVGAAESAFPSMWFPLDPEVGDVEQVSADALTARLRGKSALVVGGTDGIGRGTAMAMSQAGANVVVVGHNPMKATSVLKNLSAVAKFPQEQSFKAYVSDLFSVKGCFSLTGQLIGNKTRFDYVVLTVGMWPDWNDPVTPSGLDKVIALDVVSRFLVTREILPLLNPGARVLNVLISTWRMVFWKDETSISTDTIQRIATGRLEGHYSVPEMLGTAGAISDTWMQVLSKQHREVGFIGTFPGVVATDLMGHGVVPTWAIPYAEAGMNAVGLDPVECGRFHAMIISSPNAARRPVTYFSVHQGLVNHHSVTLEGRLTNSLAYDEEFGQWVSSFLNKTVIHGTSVVEGEDVIASRPTNRRDVLVV